MFTKLSFRLGLALALVGLPVAIPGAVGEVCNVVACAAAAINRDNSSWNSTTQTWDQIQWSGTSHHRHQLHANNYDFIFTGSATMTVNGGDVGSGTCNFSPTPGDTCSIGPILSPAYGPGIAPGQLRMAFTGTTWAIDTASEVRTQVS